MCPLSVSSGNQLENGFLKIPLAAGRATEAESGDHVTQGPLRNRQHRRHVLDGEQAVIAFTVIGVHRGKVTVNAERRANVKGGDVRFTPESGPFSARAFLSANDP